MRLIYTSPCKMFRIVEVPDHDSTLEDLKGECFDFEASGYTGTREQLKKEEEGFERTVESEGVFGYILEVWNPAPNCGWTHLDSCYGFIGQYNSKIESQRHDIIDEMKGTIVRKRESSHGA